MDLTRWLFRACEIPLRPEAVAMAMWSLVVIALPASLLPLILSLPLPLRGMGIVGGKSGMNNVCWRYFLFLHSQLCCC